MEGVIPKNVYKRGDFILWRDAKGVHNVHRSEFRTIYVDESSAAEGIYRVVINSPSVFLSWSFECKGKESKTLADNLYRGFTHILISTDINAEFKVL